MAVTSTHQQIHQRRFVGDPICLELLPRAPSTPMVHQRAVWRRVETKQVSTVWSARNALTPQSHYCGPATCVRFQTPLGFKELVIQSRFGAGAKDVSIVTGEVRRSSRGGPRPTLSYAAAWST